jgi:hypothetical protein
MHCRISLILCSLLAACHGDSGAVDGDADVGARDGGSDADGSRVSPDAQGPDCTALGSGWVQLGGDLAPLAGLTDDATVFRIAVTGRTRPTVFWQYYPALNTTSRGAVAELVDGSWQAMGGPLDAPEGGMVDAAIGRDASRVAITYHAGGNQLETWNGSAWAPPSATELDTFPITGAAPSLAMGPGEIAVELSEYYGNMGGPMNLEIARVRDNGALALEHPRSSAWAADENLRPHGVFYDAGGHLLVVVDASDGSQVLVRQDDATWAVHPAGMLAAGIERAVQDRAGTIYVRGGDLVVYRLDAAAWTAISGPGMAFTGLAIDGQGRPVMVALSGTAIVTSRWNGSSWAPLGNLQEGAQGSRGVTISIDDCGRPLLASYIGPDAGADRIEVFRYDGD